MPASRVRFIVVVIYLATTDSYRMGGTRHILKQFIATSGQRVLLPFYHAVASKQPEHVLPSMFHVRKPEQFEQDLKFFLSIGSAVSLGELGKIIDHGLRSDKPVFHVTFDDGLREFRDYALPILARYQVPATVFVNTDFVDNRDMFYRFKVALILNRSRQSPGTSQKLENATHAELPFIEATAAEAGVDFSDYLAQARPYLTMDELRILRKQGVSIGSHSCDHIWFRFLSEDGMKSQVTRSFSWLKKNIGGDPQAFSFPFSDEGVPASFLKWLHHDFGCKLSFGTSGLKRDVIPTHLHRIPMENSLEPASKIVMREYLKCIARTPLGKNTISRS